jgi:hypothetical protein
MRLANCLWFALIFIGSTLHAQVYNNGATITVTANGMIFCTGDFQNASGTVTNDGRIEVQGNFSNAGTYTTTTSDDSLIMSGSTAATLDAGAAALSYLTINKSSGIKVTLANNTTINTKLDYTEGIFTTDPLNTSYILTAPVSATFNFATGKEIIGRVKRTSWAGSSATVFNQPNMLITTTGGTSPTDFTVNMIPQSEGGDPTQNEREVKRYFQFAYTGGSGFSATARFPYVSGDLNTNAEANLIPWKLNGTEWTGRLGSLTKDAANDYVQSGAIPADTLLQEWKLADPNYNITAQVILRGPWNSGTGLMNTSLNAILPLNQPFNVGPFNYTGTESVASIPSTSIVDWVLLEVRKPAVTANANATSSTITGRKAVFLLNNGTIVDLDGSSTPSIPIYKQGAGNYIAVRHRNHLGALSNISYATSTGLSNDFRILANVYKNLTATSNPVTTLSSTSNYGLWAGDAAGTTGAGSVNSTDGSAVKNAIAALLSGYQRTDINMNNSINSSDVTLIKQTISNLGATSNPARMSGNSNATTQEASSSLPE